MIISKIRKYDQYNMIKYINNFSSIIVYYKAENYEAKSR